MVLSANLWRLNYEVADFHVSSEVVYIEIEIVMDLNPSGCSWLASSGGSH